MCTIREINPNRQFQLYPLVIWACLHTCTNAAKLNMMRSFSASVLRCICAMELMKVDRFEWQDRVLAMIDATKGPFHLRVRVPRQRGATIFALNLARGRRYHVMHVLELMKLRRKGTSYMIGPGIRKRGRTAVEDLHQREVKMTKAGLQFVGNDFEGLVVDGVWSDEQLLTDAELAALQDRCVVEIITDHDPDYINRDVRAEFVHNAE